MTREELINSKEYKMVNAAFDWIEEHQDADLLDAFEAGNEWGNKQAVEKACKWLENTFHDRSRHSGRGDAGEIVTYDFDSMQEFILKFRKAMEEQ